MKKGLLIALALVFAVAACSLMAAEKKQGYHQPTFTEAEYLAHLKFLADDICEGRGPGTRGGTIAAAYIAAQFEALGLQPFSEDSGYYQQVPLVGITTRQESGSFSLSAGDQSVSYTMVDDVVINSEQTINKVSIDEDVLFVGYGIVAPEFDWDDYKGVDCKDRVLLMLVNDPDLEKTGFYNESLSFYGRWTYKELIARKLGAKAIILMHTDEAATYPFTVVQSSYAIERIYIEGGVKNPLLMKTWISQPAVDKALAFVGTSYEDLKAKADSRDFKPFEIGLHLKNGFEQDYRKFDSPNVIGVLPGTTNADEAVILCGHYDHFPPGRAIDGDNIYNGARDNASGIAGIICLARAFTEMPRPERTMIFIATTAEEFGLLGSEYYSEHPLIPLAKTAMAVNIDAMNLVGVVNRFGAGIVKFTDAIETVKRLGAEVGLELFIGGVDTAGGTFRSDHFPLCARGVVAFSTGTSGTILGMTEEETEAFNKELFAGRYHQPNDEMDPRWRYDGIIQELNLDYKLLRYWADGAPAPKLNEDNPYVPAIRMMLDK